LAANGTLSSNLAQAEVEKSQRHFIRRTFYLPQNAPDYAINLKTWLPSFFAYMLGLHFEYVRKVREMPQNRSPNIIVKHLLENRSQCFHAIVVRMSAGVGRTTCKSYLSDS